MTDYIHASNGDGVPVTAIITTDRGISSTELIVDSILNWPTYGIGTSGTRDAITGVITDKTVFKYHLDGSIIVIETFAAGYSDIGNFTDQVVMLKPTTEWANKVADRVNEIELGAQWLNGAGVPSNTLGNNGDYYLNTSNNDIYTKVSGTWGSPIVNIKGATGTAGTNGTNGTNGATIRTGAGAPSSGLGVDGDYYINTTNDDLYFKASGTYSVVGNLKGSTGNTGSTGAKGDTGTAGIGTLVGDIVMSLRATPGVNRLFMAGGVYNKADYPALWALNASHPAYFTASDATTFTLADMRQRVPVGKYASGTFATLGATGGAETHTLITAEMPAHKHPQLTAIAAWSAPGAYRNNLTSNSNWASNPDSNQSQNVGGGGAHNNLQPYIVVNYEIVAV